MQKGVYDALMREKRGSESFTSVIRRLLDQRGGLEDLSGAWGKVAERQDLSALRQLRSEERRR